MEGFDTSLAEGLALMTPFDADATDERYRSPSLPSIKEKMDGLRCPTSSPLTAYDCHLRASTRPCNAAGITGNESASEICEALKASVRPP